MEAEVRRHNSVLRWDLQLILCPRERGCIAVPEAAIPARDVFHIAVRHFPYDWQSTLAPDSGCDLFFPPILSAHWSHEEYHGPVCSTKLWAGERFRQPQNWRLKAEGRPLLHCEQRILMGFWHNAHFRTKINLRGGWHEGDLDDTIPEEQWRCGWRAESSSQLSQKTKNLHKWKKNQQTSVTENSSIPFFYTANSGRGFYRFILNVNIPVETSQ